MVRFAVELKSSVAEAWHRVPSVRSAEIAFLARGMKDRLFANRLPALRLLSIPFLTWNWLDMAGEYEQIAFRRWVCRDTIRLVL